MPSLAQPAEPEPQVPSACIHTSWLDVTYSAFPTCQYSNQLGQRTVNSVQTHDKHAAALVFRHLTLVWDMPDDAHLAVALSHMPDLQVQLPVL